jgi:tRNA-specific 2-thiouridylase
LQQCKIQQLAKKRYLVTFAAPQWAIAPGQAIALYQAGVCFGGGVIERSFTHSTT